MLFATKYPEMMEKLIVADIGPKYYAPHHQDILAGLNAVDFSSKPDRTAVEEILFPFIPDYGTRQFLMKSLYWKEPGQLAFRFNLDVFNRKVEEVGKTLPENAIFEKPTLFIRGGNSNYILDADFPEIKEHFPNLELATIPNTGHWLHAENPNLFFRETALFLNSKILK
jgi:pimeloyl-ACP methyl ester carboxylesterase